MLRPFVEDDLDDLARILGREDVNRYLYSAPRDLEQSRTALRARMGHPEAIVEENILAVAVVSRESERVIGDFMLRWTQNEHRQGEVGGSLHPEEHGRGYATEIYHELVRLAFFQYDLHRVVGRCDARNAASIRSLEKAGFTREAHLVENEFVKGEWTSEVILALRRGTWLSALPRGAATYGPGVSDP